MSLLWKENVLLKGRKLKKMDLKIIVFEEKTKKKVMYFYLGGFNAFSGRP
jgi:hypothetical protein